MVTVTGCCDVVTRWDLPMCKEGTVFANAGHFDVEVNMESLTKFADSKPIRENMAEWDFFDKKFYVLAEGKLVNIVAGDGHPIEIMDLSFAVQFASVMRIANEVKV